MRIKIKDTNEEVEVGQYKQVDKGSLKAFFSLVEYPSGRKTLDCRHFVQGDMQWFNFPQKEIKKQDGSKSEYIPIVSYLNKPYLENLKSAVIQAINAVTKESNGKANIPQKQTAALQDDASALWF